MRVDDIDPFSRRWIVGPGREPYGATRWRGFESLLEGFDVVDFQDWFLKFAAGTISGYPDLALTRAARVGGALGSLLIAALLNYLNDYEFMGTALAILTPVMTLGVIVASFFDAE